MNMSMGVFIATHCQGEVGTGIENTAPPSALPDPPVIGTAMQYTPGTWSSGTPEFARWESSADGSVWATAAAMPDADSPPTDAEFGLLLRVVETNGVASAESAAVGPVDYTLEGYVDLLAMTTWFQADRGDIAALSDGAQVATWDDTGSANLDLSRTPDSAVTYQTNELNGLPAVFLNAGFLTSDSALGSTILSTNQGSFVAVFKHVSAHTQNALLSWWQNNANEVALLASWNDVLYFDYANGTTGRISGAKPSGWGDAWHIVEFHRQSNGQGRIVVDGTVVVSGTFSAALDTALSSPIRVGSTTGAAPNVRMYVYAIGHSKTALTQSQYEHLRGLLSERTGIAIAGFP